MNLYSYMISTFYLYFYRYTYFFFVAPVIKYDSHALLDINFFKTGIAKPYIYTNLDL